MKINKISFCTVCMNRLHHLKQTLVKNLEDNKDYPDDSLEFVILDYNSSDGLEEWVKGELSDYIKRGIVKFYRTEEPVYFDRSHSRNLMFKLATGTIICNMDADNYTGKNFSNYINSVFQAHENIFLVADTQKRYYFLRNAFGRFCVLKKDFISLGGLDEKMKSYGSETIDLYERLEKSGKREVIIENTDFLKTISHGDEERISNEFFLKSLDRFFIQYISYEESEVLFLYKDQSFESAHVIPENESNQLPATLLPGSLKKGTWQQVGPDVLLSFSNGETSFLSNAGKDLTDPSSDRLYSLIEDSRFLLHVAKNYAFITNVETQENNKKEQKLIVNDLVFGRGTVHGYSKEQIEVQ